MASGNKEKTAARRGLPVGITLAAAVVLAGCATSRPQPLAADTVVATSQADIQQLRGEVEPLAGPLTLEQAIARALKYNLDRRVRLMEEALAQGQWEAGQYDMLPKLTASAGYRERSNDLISRSSDSVTGAPSLAHPYISSDRAAVTTDLSFTWSLLDFGQSYYASRAGANRFLVAGERRRKAMHLLIQDVRTAFWRLASAQKLRGTVQATIADAEGALELARKAEAERLRSPLDSLRYQRQLLENLRLLESVDQELSTARIELASLARLPLSGELLVAEPAQELATWWQDLPAEAMEERALAQNADLRESFLNGRIAADEARRSLARLFPGLSFSYGLRQSNDGYLINQHWNEAGLQLSYNLFGLLSLNAQKAAGQAGIELARQQRLAATLGVLTQVHLARLQLANAYRQYQRADGIWKVDRGIAAQISNREQAQTQTRLDSIANQTSAILSELRRYQAMATVQAAASKLQATLGAELQIDAAKSGSVAELAQSVGAAMQRWDAGLPGAAGRP